MYIHDWRSVCIYIMTRRTKNIGVPNCHSNRKSAILIQLSHCTPFSSISMPRTLTNSSYKLNPTDFQFNYYHPQTLNMRTYQQLLPTSNMVGVMVWSIFMLRHKASSPHIFNIQFSMYTKFITHVNDVALNTFMHQYWVISVRTCPLVSSSSGGSVCVSVLQLSPNALLPHQRVGKPPLSLPFCPGKEMTLNR